jgi:uncharacterized iron-regulated protein
MFLRYFRQFRIGLRAPFVMAAASLGWAACAADVANTPARAPASPSRAAKEPLPADIVARSALPLHVLAGGERLTEPELWDRMATFQVVCLGERHDSPQHHYAQQRSIEELAKRAVAAKRPLAVGLEMFQRPYQGPLSAFVSGSMSEEQFLEDSEYDQRWGFDFALYRPLLESAREFQLPTLALNAPRELTRKIGRSGLRALDADEQKQLPELDLASAEHRAYFTKAMAEHPMPAGGPQLDDMYAVQVVWDETMAETGARWLASSDAGAQLVVVAGSGHCHRVAIPGRISRRIHATALSVVAVLESKLSELEERDRYDWLLVLEDGAAKASP